MLARLEVQFQLLEHVFRVDALMDVFSILVLDSDGREPLDTGASELNAIRVLFERKGVPSSSELQADRCALVSLGSSRRTTGLLPVDPSCSNRSCLGWRRGWLGGSRSIPENRTSLSGGLFWHDLALLL